MENNFPHFLFKQINVVAVPHSDPGAPCPGSRKPPYGGRENVSRTARGKVGQLNGVPPKPVIDLISEPARNATAANPRKIRRNPSSNIVPSEKDASPTSSGVALAPLGPPMLSGPR